MKLAEYIKSSFNYIFESRNYIYIVFWTFIVGTVLGFFLSENLVFLDDLIRQLFERTKDLETYELISFIFFNNLKVAVVSLFSFVNILAVFFTQNPAQFFLLLIFSIFGFLLGIFPVFFVFFNGLLLGYVFSSINLTDLWKILPHGIFELPAIFISAGLGMKLSLFLFSRKPKKEFKKRFFDSFRVLLFVIIPLLLVAAVIESLLIMFYK